ncbi:PHP domain-containing protein [Haloarcula hispanica]|uniref:histidinol-phosphatase n=1 Tax=Haloarcula hispanica TaxID=51589 RepID=A0A5J5LEH1_HALHI|nr:PHP domain-containing protein [Haloarcula hispanica]KAA9404934.1 PHP domain-containing protein [Haloarcula hispanica]
MRTDIHTHTTYSDGSDLDAMITAAEQAGLSALGLTDHCIVTEDDFGRRAKYDLVETYQQRREDIRAARDTTALQLYDAAEVSYVEGTEARIASFLDTADFAYTIGSVHFADQYDYTSRTQYVTASATQRRRAVERYYDAVVALIESELFDVVGHLDLPERIPTLRRHTTRADYDRVARALADSETVPEVNAGRVHRSLGRVHPDPAMLDLFTEYGIQFVLGSDSHTPAELSQRVPELRTLTETLDRSPVAAVLRDNQQYRDF